MVVEVDETSCLGSVSYSVDGTRHLIEMPLSEISRCVSLGANLKLDNVNSENLSSRVVKENDGWFFKAREGLKGPFNTAGEAEQGLGQYIVSAQSA